jgi:hypothetical protein
MHYITEDATGYLVEAPSIGVRKHFPFHDEAGRASALAAAILYRHQNLRDTPHADAILESRKGKSSYLPHRSSSGGPSSVSGVVLEIQSRGGSLLPRATFNALYRDEDGRYRKKSFGIRKHGYEAAFRLALAERSKFLIGLATSLYDIPLPLPTKSQYELIKQLTDDIPHPKKVAEAP